MKHFIVTVNDGEKKLSYSAIAQCSLDCVLSAFDVFGVCSVSVKAKA